MKKNVNNINIIKSGGMSVSLDHISFGSGNPKTLILSGIHGNEKTGNLVIARLLEKLPEFKGTLTILPIVNPLGYSQNQRVEPLSGLDLNRQFTGKNDGRPAHLITNAVMRLAEEYDYVIDLHNYKTAGLLQVAFSNTKKAKNLVQLLSPDVIRAPHTDTKFKLTGTLMSWLKSKKIPAVLVELSHQLSITDEQSLRIVTGIKTHLTSCDKRTKLIDNIDTLPFVRIKLIKSPQTGVCYYGIKLSLGDKVKKGDLLGKIVSLPSGETFKIISPSGGIICEKESQNEYPTMAGDALFGIGEVVR